MFPHWRLTMTSHQQLMGNTPRSCPSSPTTPPAHTDQPTQRSSGQQGASPLTHSPKPGPKGPGSVSHRCAFPMLRMKANCRLDGPGNMSSTRKASPPAPRGKSTQVENGIYQTTCAERLCVLPGRGAGAAGGKSGKRSTGGGGNTWRAFHCQVTVLNLAQSTDLIKRCYYTAPISWP